MRSQGGEEKRDSDRSTSDYMRANSIDERNALEIRVTEELNLLKKKMEKRARQRGLMWTREQRQTPYERRNLEADRAEFSAYVMNHQGRKQQQNNLR